MSCVHHCLSRRGKKAREARRHIAPRGVPRGVRSNGMRSMLAISLLSRSEDVLSDNYHPGYKASGLAQTSHFSSTHSESDGQVEIGGDAQKLKHARRQG